jgi:rootletin
LELELGQVARERTELSNQLSMGARKREGLAEELSRIRQRLEQANETNSRINRNLEDLVKECEDKQVSEILLHNVELKVSLSIIIF